MGGSVAERRNFGLAIVCTELRKVPLRAQGAEAYSLITVTIGHETRFCERCQLDAGRLIVKAATPP